MNNGEETRLEDLSARRAFDRLGIEQQCTRFVVVALGYWGAGKTLKEAKRNCMREGAKAKDKMLAYWGDDSLSVTSAGYVQADKALLSLGEI